MLYLFQTFVFMLFGVEQPKEDRGRNLLGSCFRHANIAFIGFDVTNRESFKDCNQYINMLHDLRPDCMLVAVGNKIDLVDQRQVSYDEARDYFNKFEPAIPYFEVSALTGEGVNELFDKSLRLLIQTQEGILNEAKEDSEAKQDEDDKRKKCIVC